MLARQDWHHPPCEPIPDVDYSGFPFWQVLLAEPNREQRSADCLKRVNIHAYLPQFTKQHRARGTRQSRARLCAVVPCMLFVPAEMLDTGNREQILDWAKLRRSKCGRHLTKAEVEVIREIEAKLNIRYDKKTYNFEIGQRVRFQSELWMAFLGEGVVIEVASHSRICIKVEQKLFGGKDTIWIPAAELEAM